jgi:glycolate oxidase FAD binding subunit
VREFKPEDQGGVSDAILTAIADNAPMEIVGSGTMRAIGRPLALSSRLDLSRLTGLKFYEPEELVLSARAGTARSEIAALLASNHQAFAFEPPDFARLLGSNQGGTLGGMIAGNLSGPRRIRSGALRDHILGFSAVSGRAEAFQCGGRVMKNVTGYDLSKLLAGSWGTLAVLDEVSVKVLPAPDQTRTLLLHGFDDVAAVKAMCAAMGSPHEVSGAAHVGDRTALRAEGVAPSVEARVKGLRDLFPGAEMEELGTFESRAFWREVRDAVPLGADADDAVWRISCAPTDGAAVVARIKAAQPFAKAFYDWSGGLIWLALPATDDAEHGLVRAGLAGHATLIRAPATARATVPVFQPQPFALAALSARVKESFDPKGLLNPGRM